MVLKRQLPECVNALHLLIEIYNSTSGATHVLLTPLQQVTEISAINTSTPSVSSPSATDWPALTISSGVDQIMIIDFNLIMS